MEKSRFYKFQKNRLQKEVLKEVKGGLRAFATIAVTNKKSDYIAWGEIDIQEGNNLAGTGFEVGRVSSKR